MTRQPAPFFRLSRGLTLVELLVFTAVLAVLAGGVTLATGRGSGPPDALRFAERFETQRSLAIAGQERRGLAFESVGMRIAVRTKAGWQMSDALAAPGGVRFDRPGPAPQVEFLPTGQTSAFAITLPDGGRCESDGWTGLSCDD